MFSESVLNAIVGSTIKCCYVHPVTFKMVFKEVRPAEIIETLEYKKLTFDRDQINHLTWETIIDAEATHLTVSTSRNGDKDRRGGGCGNLNIPIQEFEYTIENPNGITLKDMTEGVYRMKGSKYDWWYELFSNLTVDFPIADDHIFVDVEFDYGS